MSLYEAVWIARQEMSASQVETLTEDLEKIVTDQGGEIKKKEYWGLKNLAYKIKKNRKGHYTLFNIEAPSEAIVEFERIMHFNEDVLRYMTIKVDELEEGPSAVVRQKDRQDEEGETGRGRKRREFSS